MAAFASATEGNHGRGVAWSAKQLGLKAVIFLTTKASSRRVEAIRREGAEVVLLEGTYEDAVQNTPLFEENGPDNFKGIDIMRTVRSFDPCLPCGVHMYLGNGKTIETRHSPMFGAMK